MHIYASRDRGLCCNVSCLTLRHSVISGDSFSVNKQLCKSIMQGSLLSSFVIKQVQQVNDNVKHGNLIDGKWDVQ